MQMKNTSIGYALPSPLLGIPLSDIPLAPWESYTICSADNCEEYPTVSASSPSSLFSAVLEIRDEILVGHF